LTAPFLRAQGVNCLHQLALTHGDVNHIGGAALIQQRFSTPTVFMSEVRFRSAAYREVHKKFSQMPGLEKMVHLGSKVGVWEVLHPGQTERGSQADDDPLVLRGTVRGTRLLLLSDLSKPGQNAVTQNNTDLQADIVVSGLPIRTEPVANLFLDIVQPKLIIITDALFPARERAGAALKQRLAHRKIPVLYTSETGSITLRLKNNGWTIATANGLQFDHLNLEPAMREFESETPPHAELEE
jgi:competence protein ComEC